jgi:hypothetical protein
MDAARNQSRVLLAVITLLLGVRILQAQTTRPTSAPSGISYDFDEPVQGIVNANGVFVRSGARETAYPTMRLDKASTIFVLGRQGEWLKIKPPSGSFCFVAKAYIDHFSEDHRLGQTTATVNVRVGSELNLLKTAVSMQLPAGETVEIIGEADEYFKIEPPAGVALYIDKASVDIGR